MRTKTDIVRDYIQKFPSAGSLTLARIIYKENATLFPTLESVRSTVRYARGKMGEKNKRKEIMPNTKHENGQAFAPIPEPISEHEEEWQSFELKASRRILVLSDVHVPFHDTEALNLAIQYGLDNGADTVILNGDFMDFFACSHYLKDPRIRDLPSEVEMAKEMLQALRERFKGCQIIWKLGNHEERWESYMYAKAPEIVGMEAFEIENWMRLSDYNVRLVKDKRPIKINQLNIVHGHEFGFVWSPVNAARGFYNRAKANVTGGHLHQSSEHTERDLNGDITTAWSSGCLCHLHPKYRPINKWNHGFQFIDTTGEDDFHLKNIRIYNGKIL